MVVSYRLGLDADGDGFINWGVSTDAPPNTYPGALYTGKSNLKGIQYTTEDVLFEDSVDISDQGFMKRTVTLGRTALVDHAEILQLGHPGETAYKLHQQRSGDPENLITNGIEWIIPGVTFNGSNSVNGEPFTAINGRFRLDSNMAGNTFGAGSHVAVGHAGTYPSGRGFLDGPTNQYTRAVGADITSDGFPVTAGLTYTFVYVLQKTTGITQTYVRVYGNNGVSGSPSYGRVYLAGADHDASETGTNPSYTDGVPSGALQAVEKHVALTFTVPVGTNRVFFDFQTGGAYILVGGLMLLEGSYSLPARYWDSSVGYDELDATILLPDNDTYVLSFWVKSSDGVTQLTGTQTIAQLNTSTNNVDSASSVAVTSSWVRHNITFPAAAYARAVYFEWTGVKAGNPTGLDNVGSVEFKGFMLTQGSTVWPYHAGTSYGHDDLTSYVLGVDTKSGKNSFHESLAYEGTMEITLNNETKRFSPENVNSPLFNVLNQNRRAVLQIYDGSDWHSLWTGWSTAIALSPGENSDNRATLSCQQGFFRLREGSFGAPLAENTTIDELVLLLIESSGWKSATVPFQSTIGYAAKVDENFFILDTSLMIGQLDEGINTLELVGQDWGRKGDIEAALKEVLTSENASLWLDRDGRFVVVNREYWVRPTTTVELDFDTDVQNGDYVYGQEVINRAEVTINRKKIDPNSTVWQTHRPFKVIPRRNPTDRVEIEIHAERVEGRQKTVITYSLDNMVKTVYEQDPGPDGANDSVVSSDMADKVSVELIPQSSGNIYRLRIVNTNSAPVWVNIELKGTLLNTEDGTPIVFEDTAAIEEQEAIHSIKITSNVLSDEVQALSTAGFYVLRNAQPAGEFVGFMMNDAATELDIPQLISMQIGTRLSISESQTCQENAIHWIIGENFNISGNVFTAKYTTARTVPGRFMLVGDDIQNGTVNAVEDWHNVQTIFGNTAEVVDDKVVFTINAPLPLYLDPAEDQIVELPVGLWAAALLRPRDEINNIFEQYPGEMFAINNDRASIGSYGHTGANNAGAIMLEADRKYRIHLFGGPQSRDFISAPNSTATNISVGLNPLNHNYLTGYYDSADFVLPVHPEGSKHHFGYLDVWYPALHTGRDLIGGPPVFVRMSNNAATTIDSTITHKYSLFARAQADTVAPATMKLTVYDYDGTEIGNHSQTLTTSIQKWEVSIPTGHTAVWATFERTPFGDGVTTAVIYGYGVTDASVSDYSELHTTQDQSIVYP